eukprot:CAMPEP_0180087204 /NCGR_PEP_ID=MMETSP0985-20121206/21563_1 /TAXON_ID=483367 /ORGANISM="non described non described, Strain CCMP 2436" /LENGTH=74 /DNA_ID=CAMNT_0022021503 /DNA_START=180 /DNA_END=401 /DNA_ORIENTATION=+
MSVHVIASRENIAIAHAAFNLPTSEPERRSATSSGSAPTSTTFFLRVGASESHAIAFAACDLPVVVPTRRSATR